jgi:hypothetical protein
VTDAERRARLARRHAVAPAHRVDGPEQATRAMTVLHATEPASVHLAVAARVREPSRAAVDRALYDERTLVKQLAMRRTLFVFPRDLLPAAWGSASARVADIEAKRVAKDAVLAGLTADGHAWLEGARERVLAGIGAAPDGLLAVEVGPLLPELRAKVAASPGATWNHSRVLTHLGLTADIVRGANSSHWRVSRPRWTTMTRWLGEAPQPLDEAAGYAEIVRRWLRTFGPGTEADLVWWLGATKAAVRRALADVRAVPVLLEHGPTGWLLPDDLDPVQPVDHWAALLPVLDPTTMGWRERDWYLDPALTAYLFDTNGNGGSTAWVDGRIVGAWVQDDAGRVRVLPRAGLARSATRALAAEAERLTEVLDGEVVGSVYKSRLMKGEPLP